MEEKKVSMLSTKTALDAPVEFLKHKGRPVNSEEAQNRNLEKT